MISTDLPARVSRTIREHNLISPGDTIIVALSGGADSCALLDILGGLDHLKPRLVVAHLNHCLRGADSDNDEEFARALAGRYCLPFESRRIQVRELARQLGLNLEDAGRRVRIDFLHEVRTRRLASAVALAHHADDQAETVLMRLLRGSGMTGLCGMSYRNERGFIRPLLDISRDGIESYLSARGLDWREDASNLDTAFLRNRIRHELLPLLTTYNPAIYERLSVTAALLADENDLLEQQAHELAAQACTYDESSVVCSLSRLGQQPPSLIRRVFRQALQRLAGTAEGFSRRHITALEHLADSPCPNAIQNLPRGITARREYGRLVLQRIDAPHNTESVEIIISGPGRYVLPDGAHLVVSVDDQTDNRENMTSACARFDLDKAPFPWHLRTFRPGDRIEQTGMTGTKKVKNLFIDEKIPLPVRRTTPLVFSGDTLIWVCGFRTSRRANTESTSTRIAAAVYCPAKSVETFQISCKPATDMLDI